MHDQHYTDSTLDSYLAGLRKVVFWLGRRRITTLAQLTQKDLQAAHDHFLLSQRKAGSVIGALKRFLSERRLVSQGNWPLTGFAWKALCPSRLSLLGNAIFSGRLNSRAAGASETHGDPLRSD
jgi:hypothetical protein